MIGPTREALIRARAPIGSGSGGLTTSIWATPMSAYCGSTDDAINYLRLEVQPSMGDESGTLKLRRTLETRTTVD